MNWERLHIDDVLSVYTLHFADHGITSVSERHTWGLAFTDRGQITYCHRGKQFVLDNKHAVILPKDQQYMIKKQAEGDFYVINFACNDIFADTITVVPMENVDVIIKDFQHLRKLFLNHGSRLLIMRLTYGIFYQLSEAYSRDSKILSPAVEYLKRHYTEEISNSFLASQCYISEEYFRKLFKKAYGISPKQYVIDLRIHMAKQLLSEGYIKINEIAKQCGFSNPYHFSRLFKEKTSETPSAYMKRNRIREL
jgi:AraC-like DNA-binding protein